MLKVIDVTQRIEFISKEDKGTPKTIFVLKPLGGLESIKLTDSVEDGKLKFSGDGLYNILNDSIVEIKNCQLEKEDMIRAIPVDVLGELIEQIGDINNLTDNDKKKS